HSNASKSPQNKRTHAVTENELLAFLGMKNFIPIANEGMPTKLAMRRAKQNSLIVSFYGETDVNEWGEKYNVTLTAEEARTVGTRLLHYANKLKKPVHEMAETAA
ncbi:MAG: hypothetical protein WBX25_12295, partial [Rhodomicrobium sp.]